MKDASPALVTVLQHIAAATVAGGGAFLVATVLDLAPFRPAIIVAAIVFFKLAYWDKAAGAR